LSVYNIVVELVATICDKFTNFFLYIYVFSETINLLRCVPYAWLFSVGRSNEKAARIITIVRFRRDNNVALRFNGSTHFTIMPIYSGVNRGWSFYQATDRATGHQNQFVTITNGASSIGTRDSSRIAIVSRDFYLRSRSTIYPTLGNTVILIVPRELYFILHFI